MNKLNLPLGENHRLVRWANSVRGLYGHPIYLVGSQLSDKENPRDIDIVCIIPDEEFSLRYGDINKWLDEGCTGKWTDVRWNWSDDCVKRSHEGMRETGYLNIDFKIQPEAAGLSYKAYPKFKLDTRSK